MADELHIYPICKSRLRKSFFSGTAQADDRRIICTGKDQIHLFITAPIDGITDDASWGRLRFDYTAGENTVLIVYALATNDKESLEILYSEDISASDKRSIMEQRGALKLINKNDMLLYSQTGRYLCVMLAFIGSGEGSAEDIKVTNRGDILLDTLPEVYQEYGSFFHRFMSAFSSMFLDFQEKVNHAADLLDTEKTPVELLPMLAHWVGLDVSGDFLPEDRLRTLVKEAYTLNRMKGTGAALERLTEIVLAEKAIVLERTVCGENMQETSKDVAKNLYGDSDYDVTLLIKTYVPDDKKSQLMFLLNQFKPVRCRLLIRFLDESAEIDSHSYMDVNASLRDYSVPVLDTRQKTDSMVVLSI